MIYLNKLSQLIRKQRPVATLKTASENLLQALARYSIDRLPLHKPIIDRRIGTVAVSGLVKLPLSQQLAPVTKAADVRSMTPLANRVNSVNTAEAGQSGFRADERRSKQTDRRQFTSKTLWHCLASPRRRNGRRKSDRRFPLLDIFDQTAMFLAVCLMTLSLTDAFLTLNIIARGGSEVNPVMNYLLQFGTFMFVASKMLMTAIPLMALVAAGNYRLFGVIRVHSVTATLIGLYGGLIVYELLILSLQ